MTARVDHLVIAAASLEKGVAWCEATLGVTPGPGGRHPLMGTHNRLLRIATERFPRAYLEIIAIDPQAPPPGRVRWFDLDDPAMQATLRGSPRLVHFIAATDDADGASRALAGLGIDRGELIAAERATPDAILRWRMTVRPDGARLFDGTLPTLIEWGSTHPVDTMPDSGLSLESFAVAHPDARLGEALRAIELREVDAAVGHARLRAVLRTPRGPITLG